MIYRQKIIDALESRLDAFTEFDLGFETERRSYINALDDLRKISKEDLDSKLAPFSDPGARPTNEFKAAEQGVIRFSEKFANHKHEREWALETLRDYTTFAADGSQVMPTKDYSIPVAAVQVGWFENKHSASGEYTKDTRLEIMTPDDLMDNTGAERQISEAAVNRRRFEMETARLCEYMLEASNESDRSVAFFDSTLVLSFAENFREKEKYKNALLAMVRCSEECRVPLIGYIDTTFARDLTTMLKSITSGLDEARKMHDAILVDVLLDRAGMKWGDRTPVYVCARPGILKEYGDFDRKIGFVYIKTNNSRPARLDFPMWIYDSGQLDKVIDIVRAEAIVGGGYPYALETADAVAVISQNDRDIFLRAFQDFAQKNKIGLKYSRKARSKAIRR